MNWKIKTVDWAYARGGIAYIVAAWVLGFQTEVRTSWDGETWSEWQRLYCSACEVRRSWVPMIQCRVRWRGKVWDVSPVYHWDPADDDPFDTAGYPTNVPEYRR